MKTIFISGRKKDKLRPGDILGALVKEAGLEASDVGNISILPIVTYVAVKTEKASHAVERLSNGIIKNRNFRVDFI
jgi:ATP-independent RNA helicase DbpA